MKTWLEVRIQINPEIEEAVSNYLFELGCTGCQQTGNAIIAYFPGDVSTQTIPEKVQRYLDELSRLRFPVPSTNLRVRSVADQDWNAEWKKYFKPVVISDKLVIKPSWDAYVSKGEEVVIEIDPKQAFGTGTHETTQIMLNLLEGYLTKSDTVLDVGTGTGILAIAAAKLGAVRIFAFDNDAVAVAAAAENFHHNVTSGIQLFAGNLHAVKKRDVSFDLILANLNKKLIIELLPVMTSMLAARGRLILSGILAEDRPEIARLLLSLPEFAILTERVMGEWLGILIEKRKNG